LTFAEFFIGKYIPTHLLNAIMHICQMLAVLRHTSKNINSKHTFSSIGQWPEISTKNTRSMKYYLDELKVSLVKHLFI